MNHPPRWLFAVLALILAYFASIVFIPLFLSFFLAILLDPVVKALVKMKFTRRVASTVAVFVFLSGSGIVLWAIYMGFSQIADDFPQYAEQLQGIVNSWRFDSERFEFLKPISKLFDNTSESDVMKVRVIQPYPAWTQYFVRGVGSIYEILSVAIFVPILLYYLLVDKVNLVESANSIAGKYLYIPKLNTELPNMVRVFFIANIITGIILVLTHALLFYLLGLHNWPSLAAFCGFLNLIPILGGPMAAIPAIIQSIVQHDPAYVLAIIVAASFLIHLIGNNILLPYIFGSRINLNSATLILGFLFWGWLWGALGFLLAIPMTSLLKILLESNPDTHALSNLMAAKPRHVLGGK